jgi:two-component system LytT family response regulator
VGDGPKPVIVFVTAHDQFAVRAFEVHAVDYLLKPFDRERFQKALRRAIEQIGGHDPGTIRQRHSALLADLKSTQLAVKSGGHIVWVKLDEIDWIGSADNYAELHIGAKSHLLRETLGALEARLTPEKFVRISRSAIVNAQHVKELHRLFYGGCELVLNDGTRLTLSRRYRDKLQQLGVK